MRAIVATSIGLAALLCASIQACSSNSNQAGFTDNPGGGSGSSSGGSSGSGSGGNSGSGGSSGSSGGSSSGLVGDGGTVVDEGGDGSITVTNTIYAHSDMTLYSVDPMSKAVTAVGPFMGTSDSSTDSVITDLAVDSNDEVYVNTESVVYKAALPASTPGTVSLTKVATIQGSAKFYALAFAPAGALDPNSEVLVGGDSTGVLWSINTTSGASVNLGSFGQDKSVSSDAGVNNFVLSGDIVFYNDASNTPTGLATIRSCPAGKTNSISYCTKDYLASVDMTALKTAYTSGTAAASLLGGIYGATTSGGVTTGPGNGTGFGDVFGLGAWDSTVFGFTRAITTPAAAPQLITIDTTSGVGTSVQSFTFNKPDDGWSGAGVTTKVTISVPKPPPPPAQ
ncbi:MAG TPA: hypothetical protein VGL81_31215 [Polyangiaceae bacterium]|jgi:hypothetical protein